MNDLDLCLEVISRSSQPLRYIRRWISRKPLQIEVWFQRTTNRKWHTGYRMVRDLWRHVTLKGKTRDPNTLRAQYLENYLSYRLQIWYAALYGECLAGAQIIFPEGGRGLGHVTQQFLAYDRTSPKLLELQTSNLVHGFVWRMTSRRTNNFPESGCGLGHVILQFLAVRSAILATAWLLVCIRYNEDSDKQQVRFGLSNCD